jgi:hypothetical protein
MKHLLWLASQVEAGQLEKSGPLALSSHSCECGSKSIALVQVCMGCFLSSFIKFAFAGGSTCEHVSTTDSELSVAVGDLTCERK